MTPQVVSLCLQFAWVGHVTIHGTVHHSWSTLRKSLQDAMVRLYVQASGCAAEENSANMSLQGIGQSAEVDKASLQQLQGQELEKFIKFNEGILEDIQRFIKSNPPKVPHNAHPAFQAAQKEMIIELQENIRAGPSKETTLLDFISFVAGHIKKVIKDEWLLLVVHAITYASKWNQMVPELLAIFPGENEVIAFGKLRGLYMTSLLSFAASWVTFKDCNNVVTASMGCARASDFNDSVCKLVRTCIINCIACLACLRFLHVCAPR